MDLDQSDYASNNTINKTTESGKPFANILIKHKLFEETTVAEDFRNKKSNE